MSDSDQDLLQRFVRNRDQDAFAELVKRHVNLVYSAALRQVRSHPLAEEIAQAVFVDLARDAARLKADPVLTSWLFTITRGKAIDVIRKESRRQLREQIALEMNAMNATESNWSHVEPLLDEAVAALEETDRTAVLLRYFENRSLREVGQALGVSDDAAQKRVSRAVERLREFFSKRKITIGAAGLTVLISANAVQSAPAVLIATISAAALSGAAISTSTFAVATKTIAMTTLQKTIFITMAIGGIASGILIHRYYQGRLKTADAELRFAADQVALAEYRREQMSTESTVANKNSPADLTEARSEVQRLREQTNSLVALRQERDQLRDALRRLRMDSQETNIQQTAFSEMVATRLDSSRQLSLAVFDFANRNRGQFPSDVQTVLNSQSTSAAVQTNADTARFEMMLSGAWDALPQNIPLKRLLLLREKEPWQNTDGLWVKTYGFADGHAEVISLADGRFDLWERQHTLAVNPTAP